MTKTKRNGMYIKLYLQLKNKYQDTVKIKKDNDKLNSAR